MVVLDAQTTTTWRALMDEARARMLTSLNRPGGAVAQLGARLDGIEEVVGSNPIGSTKNMGSNPETWVPAPNSENRTR
jgi:hypothetical protein